MPRFPEVDYECETDYQCTYSECGAKGDILRPTTAFGREVLLCTACGTFIYYQESLRGSSS